jgi:PAS domain S-box-containing protein
MAGHPGSGGSDAVRERTRWLETVVDTLPGMVYRCRNDPEWPMERVEGAVAELTGYTAADLEGGEVRWGEEVIHPEDSGPLWDVVQAALDDDGTFQTTYRIVTADGRPRWVWERGRGVYDDQGDLEALEGFVTDVSARKEREQALTGLHSIAVDLATLDSVEAICERTVEASENVLDFDLSIIDIEVDGDLRKAAISEEIPLADTRTMSVDEGLAGKTYRTGESTLAADLRDVEAADPLGPYRSCISIPLGEHGVFQAVAEEAAAFDESDLELAELLVSHTTSALDRLEREREIRRQNERLERFASIVSHDLRNPLSVAKGRIELLEAEYDGDHAQPIADALERMTTIVEDTLTLAREGRTVDDPKPVDLSDLADGSWDNVATAGATLELEGEVVVHGDPDRLPHVIENLFRNAIEHGDGSVTVRIGSLPGGFYVEDDGPGIPADAREDVFEVRHSTAEDGTGFGLSIVEEIVEAHGWTIDVTTGRDGGARFEITGLESTRG